MIIIKAKNHAITVSPLLTDHANAGSIKKQTSNIIDLSKADNYEITLSSPVILEFKNALKGQSGVIKINNARNITRFNGVTFADVNMDPSNFKKHVIFAYFNFSDGIMLNKIFEQD